MRIVLEILDGPLAGRMIELMPGQSLSIGRTAKSQLVLPQDTFLSGLHFAVEYRANGVFARDCNSSNGTFVNGEKIAECALVHGDQLSAGQTRFQVLVGVAESDISRTSLFNSADVTRTMESVVALSPVQKSLVDYLKRSPSPLYVVLNAGASERALQMVMDSGELNQNIAEGLVAGDSPAPAVYLAHLPPNSSLLTSLIQVGWGKHCLLLLTCAHPFADVRTHLRQFLLVQTEGGKRFFNRYYDPRILQFMLPESSGRELALFFGPIQFLLMEDAYDPSKLLEFCLTQQGLTGRVHPLV